MPIRNGSRLTATAIARSVIHMADQARLLPSRSSHSRRGIPSLTQSLRAFSRRWSKYWMFSSSGIGVPSAPLVVTS